MAKGTASTERTERTVVRGLAPVAARSNRLTAGAKCCANTNKWPQHVADYSCPHAAVRLAQGDKGLVPSSNDSSGERHGCGRKCSMASASGAYGTSGRRAGSRSSARVSALPGASGSAVSARGAEESSPSGRVQSRGEPECRRWFRRELGLGGTATGAVAAASRRGPSSSMRGPSSAGGMRDSLADRHRSMRMRSKELPAAHLVVGAKGVGCELEAGTADTRWVGWSVRAR